MYVNNPIISNFSGKRPQIRKKRAYEKGRPASMTKLMPQRVHMVRTRGGNKKETGSLTFVQF